MKSTEYLYGVSIKELPSMEEAYKERISRAKELLDSLLDIPLEQRDTARITAVVKAIEHNRKLMKGEI
jgi:hypothetical protein